MPTWCHMFNSTLIGSARVWFDKLPPKSIDNYEMLRKAFLGNFSQQKKYIKDPVEIHHIKQREEEFTEAFMERFKAESMHVNGAPECMRIFGFMHDITNPYLIKKLNDNIPKSVDEMMNGTTAFLRREVAATNQSRKKVQPTWRHHEANHKPNFDKRPDFKSQHKADRRQDRFTPLTKTPKEILAMQTVKFKAPPPMTGPIENQNKNKFYEFHGDKGHTRRQARRTREGHQEGGNPQQRESYCDLHGPTLATNDKEKDHPKLLCGREITFLPLESSGGQENPIVIEAEVEGHLIHRMYVDGGSASEVLYDQCFNKLRPEIKNQMVLATTPLLGFRSEISWPLGQISLMVSLGDGEHSTSTMMNFMVVIFSSPYNGAPNGPPPPEPTAVEGIKVAIHPEYLKQTVTIDGSLSEKGRMELCNMLKDNLDIFP
ncbi:reverse transcriptase domain-containing protein [Tanacetum coccineum]